MKIEGNKLTADEGKIIVNKSDSEINGKIFYLGIYDNADNYEEINEPENKSV